MKTELINALSEAGRFMLHNDLTWGNAGNLSARINPDQFVITASGTQLGELTQDNFVILDFGGRSISPGKPSKETPMHRAVYEMRSEIQAVVHASPFYSTLIACSDLEIPNNLFVENMYYLERVRRVNYHHPGTNALADEVRDIAADTNIILMQNHGVLVYDISVMEALVALQTLEMVSRMVITAKQAGIDLKALPMETVTDFLKNSGYRAPRQWRP